MIVYQASKRQFIHDTFHDDIEFVLSQQYLRTTGRQPAPAEFKAWQNSLFEVGEVLRDDAIPDDMGVALEYTVPQTSKRIDVLLTGEDEAGTPKLVIIELKQWSEARFSEKDGIIWARRGGKAGETEGPHPSYQAWSYAALLNDFNTAVYEGGVALQPCAYLHNYPRRDGVIDHPAYATHLQRAPLFLKKEADQLKAFIRQHVPHGDKRQLLYLIEHGKIRPSKMLADSVAGLLQGKQEFVLVDDQKLVFETALQADAKAHKGLDQGKTPRKQVVIVQGGPGTGKTVVAVNLLAALLQRQRNARYVSKNAAPRSVYAAKLTGTFKKTHIHNLFSGSGGFVGCEANTFDTLLVDEAHRLNEKSGLYGNLGEHQVKEVINAARCTVFFVDDDQRVTLADVGHSDELRHWARQLGAEVTELTLASQFRCNGSDGYLAWLDDVLGIRPTANTELDARDYDFKVLNSPTELHALIEEKNRANNKARVVAGYCWGWPSKKDPNAFDIVMPEHGYRRQWNLTQDGSLWIMADESVAQVGCIHTCQGLEVDHVGVIIGPDLVYRDGRIQTDPKARAKSDKSIKGLGALMKRNPSEAQALADRIIKNTYRTLMTRGMKGCYVYCCDPALAEYLRARLGQRAAPVAVAAEAPAAPPPSAKVLPLRRVSQAERAQGVPAVPVVSLKFAAGTFSDPQALEDGATEWVELPEWVKPQPGLFVAQVMGESMNKRIPNGAWCLFRANPQGTRHGKIVVVQHRSISDPETGGSYTIKRYRSEKVMDEDGGWRHERIELVPESDGVGFEVMTVNPQDADGLAVIAEWLMVVE
ncbi:MAG: DNA/RNA helicase domain-containing protein [Aquabacterium sp.]